MTHIPTPPLADALAALIGGTCDYDDRGDLVISISGLDVITCRVRQVVLLPDTILGTFGDGAELLAAAYRARRSERAA